MDYTLLTAAHIHEKTPPKMDAKREQEYYENAAGASKRLEGLLKVALFPTTLPTYFLDLACLAASHFGQLPRTSTTDGRSVEA
jgi:hypothetical protein